MNEKKAYDSSLIEKISNSKIFVTSSNQPPADIGIFVNPNAGGDSEMAIVSVCSVDGVLVLLGMESHSVKTAAQANKLLLSHVKALRSIEWTKYAHITLFTEKNTGHETGHLANALQSNDDNCSIFAESKSDQANNKQNFDLNSGYSPTASNKSNWLVASRVKLSTETVMWADCAFSSNPFENTSDASKLSKEQSKLYEQMARCSIYKKSRDDDDNEIYVWSGKSNARGEVQSGYNDDLVLTFSAMCWVWPMSMSEKPFF